MTIPWEWSTVTTFVSTFLASTFVASAAGAVVGIGIAGMLIRIVLRAFLH